MLDYIKSKIQEQLHADDAFQEQQEEALMNETILECAHLVQELDDLSIEGTEAGSSRPFTKIDIPLEDDVEITAVELDALDGRVLSAPMDATVQESDTVYVGLKTYDDFYQEAYGATTQFQRETDDQFAHRVEAIASKNYAAYKNYCFQEGLYGFDKMNINDQRVPARVVINFGKLNGKEYSVKLAAKFEVDKKGRILKKQLDSLIAFKNTMDSEDFMQGAAFAAFSQKLGLGAEDIDKIWTKVTPVELVVPVKPSSAFCVAIGCELDGSGDDIQYIEWHASIKDKGKKVETTTPSAEEIRKLNAITKGEAIRQEAAMIASGYHAPSRFVQEAIDFGDPDAAPDANPDAPAVSFDAPPADGMEQPAGGDAATTATADAGTAAPPADGATTDAPAEGTDATAEDPNAQPKEPVDTNDVSDQIAEKISDETQNDANADADLNIDGVDATSDVDAPTDENIDAELGEPAPDDTASTEPADETSDVDFDNMTIDELLAQGQEKMKTMTMQQLKDFLQGEASPTADGVPAADDEASVQESFQLVLEGAKEKGQTVRNRISNAMEDMQKNLKTMHEALSKDSTRREIQKLWASVNTSNSETFGVQLGSGIIESTMSAIAGLVSTVASSMSSLFAGGFTSSQTKTYSGENFRKSIQYVDSFLKTATKKKRIKNTFTSEEINKLTRYREDINDLIDTAEQAFSGGKAAMDVSLKQLDAAVVKVMDQYNSVKSIVTTQAAGDAIIEEAFFLTRGNIGKELDIHLRKALGILNDNEMEIEQLCTAFRKEGKQLNRVVHKASTMKKVFNETECKQLLKLNHCLSDLMTMLRSNIDKGSIMTVKRMIQAFVQEATGVLKMIEQKNNPGKPVQEGFLGNLFRSSKMKAKSVEQICEDLIDMWDVDDSVWNARELSEIVYEKDPMTFHVFIGDWLPESALKCALIVEKCIHDHPAGCNKFKELQEKFENFANRFNDMLATNDDRELTVSEYETLQELKDFIPEMKTTVREFLSEIDSSGQVQEGFFGDLWDKAKENADKKFPKTKPRPKSDNQTSTSENFPIDSELFNKILKSIESETMTKIALIQDAGKLNHPSPTDSYQFGKPAYAPVIPKTSNGKEMRFILQINLADVPSITPELPKTGLIQLWLGPLGRDGNESKVLYYKNTDKQSIADKVSDDVYKDDYLEYPMFSNGTQAIKITFKESSESLAACTSDEIHDFSKMFADKWNEYDPDNKHTPDEVSTIISKHPKRFPKENADDKIGGYPFFIQYDDRNKSYTVDNTFTLLQLSSHDELMWGDMGVSQLFITKSDLKKCNFAKSDFISQCY